MTSRAKPSGDSLSTGAADRKPQVATDPFILTLCQLSAPVTIRPPQAAHLKSFSFFTSRSRQPDGSERLHLHMGYFATLELAQEWAQRMRGAYPQATAMRAPAAFLQKRDATVPTLTPADDKNLTDTQVLKILETRRVSPGVEAVVEKESAKVALLRPDDTNTRRALKMAVVENAPVSFAVQLQWSVQPIDLTSVPSLPILKAYTLYATEGHREGRTWYSLRLGFFSDAISAKQVAHYVRSSFESVAVVPIGEAERAGAAENRINLRMRPRQVDGLEQTRDMLAPSEMWNGDSLRR